MKLVKLQLFVIALALLIAGSAFASLSYDITVDTSSMAGTNGYLYLQYNPFNNAVASTATVSLFTMNGGSLGAQDTVDVVNGSAVTGTLPASVTFANTNSVNDYNQAITFGNSLSFLLSLNSTPGAPALGVSTFSLGLFADAAGSTPLINVNDPNIAGTGGTVNLFNNGSATAQSMDSSVTVTPIPAAAWLLGSGLMGLVGIRRKMQS
ncbi:MAG: NF038129 family PEP-CTERM protein [Dissulfurispiraceae bacterium]